MHHVKTVLLKFYNKIILPINTFSHPINHGKVINKTHFYRTEQPIQINKNRSNFRIYTKSNCSVMTGLWFMLHDFVLSVSRSVAILRLNDDIFACGAANSLNQLRGTVQREKKTHSLAPRNLFG